jgi:hypothetical protein
MAGEVLGGRAGLGGTGFLEALNTRWHKVALIGFMAIVLAHWAEHLAQAFQIWGLGWEVKESRGVLGLAFPWLVTSEWLHYGYALIMLAGLIILRKGFVGRARTLWNIALGVQVWHHFEHLLLLIQAATGSYIFGRSEPTSIIQLLAPRVELHLFYNAVVFAPMLAAMIVHLRPLPDERALMRCSCARA